VHWLQSLYHIIITPNIVYANHCCYCDCLVVPLQSAVRFACAHTWAWGTISQVPAAPTEAKPKSTLKPVLAYDPDVDGDPDAPDEGEEGDTEEVPEETDEMKAEAQAAKEGTSQDKAAFHMWRQDPVVTKKLRGQYDAS
jgi:hypothetical protein